MVGCWQFGLARNGRLLAVGCWLGLEILLRETPIFEEVPQRP